MAPSQPNDIPLGTVLRETYEIAGVLGRGGMGTVFLANHLRLRGRQVAIKVLRHDAGMGAEAFVRFRREAEIASKLGHPNIVEVLDFDSLEDGSPYMVMECLRGMPLSRRLRKGPMTLEEVFSCARQMGSALQAAHRAGIVHRDLKPGNVFLVPTEVGGVMMEHVKLLDFGISKVIDSQSVHTQGGILLGTPQYMAPEQATGKNGEVDPRTDIFAFGCLVYEMLARRLPFRDNGNLPELIYRIVYDPPEPLEALVPDLPDHVIAAVEKSLEKRPEDRFPDVASFIFALTGRALQTMGEVPMLTPLRTPQLAVGLAPESKPETVPGRRSGRGTEDEDVDVNPPDVNPPFRESETVSLSAPVPAVAPSHDAATIAEAMPLPEMEAPPPRPVVAPADVVPAPIARSPVAGRQPWRLQRRGREIPGTRPWRGPRRPGMAPWPERARPRHLRKRAASPRPVRPVPAKSPLPRRSPSPRRPRKSAAPARRFLSRQEARRPAPRRRRWSPRPSRGRPWPRETPVAPGRRMPPALEHPRPTRGPWRPPCCCVQRRARRGPARLASSPPSRSAS
ncbi:serine/threonine-protein kinase [Myxococcus sp. MxC21-1]|uniref:serine/threonine-protein kinase n=1 Tax=Myxococcus sp. MxC21-1 TaxID=3041439 RepID=UPI002930F3EF|nr:serine/threonine-protein kinase [Myxococcus sp. MxC21-1]WNZ63149.1 serine/threonine-protein kinase [Myxococcus sp. MxC21-1]